MRDRGAVELSEGVWWTLRAGVFLCFVGHGAFGLITKEAWVPFFAVTSLGRETAYRLMPLIGMGDIVIGTLTLVRPRAALTAYMVVWALWTAALRPLSGLPGWEMIERAGNYGVPLALLVLTLRTRDWRSWLAPSTMRTLSPPLVRQLRLILALTTALLLVGHGALSLDGKSEIVAHYALLAPSGAVMLAHWMGGIEIALAALVLWRQPLALCLGIFVWKLATESLFLFAGAPVWEVVERGGSYAAPLALALLAWGESTHRSAQRVPSTADKGNVHPHRVIAA